MEQGPSGRRILANTAFRSIADVGSKLASLALFIVLARKVGDAQFGVYSFAFAFAGLTTTLGSLGQDAILIREVSRDRTRLEEYFASTMALRLLLALPVLLLALAAATALGMDSQARTVALLLGLGMTIELLSQTVLAVFQAYERVEYVAVVLIAQRWVTAGAGIAALALGAGIETVAAIYLAGAALGFALAMLFMRARIARPRVRVDRGRLTPLLRATGPVAVAAIAIVFLARVDMAILAIFKSDEVVGRYGAAYRVYESTLFIGWAVTAAMLPSMSRLTRTSTPPLGTVFERGLKLVIALALPLTAASVVLAEPLVRTLFGAEFEGGATALRILAPGMTLAALSYVASHLLIGQDLQMAMARIYVLIALANIAANFVLIPILSLDGAALNTVVSEALIVAALLRSAMHMTGPLDWKRVVSGPVLAAALSAGVMALLRDTFAVAAVAGAVTYLAALLVFERRAYPEDAAQLAFRPDRRASSRQ